jgi:hypothetical protein
VTLIAVVGATGTGKTALSLDIADAVVALGARCELVNCDAMQLYRGMDIGTAKASAQERRGHPHHLIDVLDPWEDAAVAAYREAALAAIAGIEARGAVPVLVGGSGLYASSALYEFAFPATDAALRAELEAELAERGPTAMHERLAAVDRAAADAIGPHNGRRLVRALEAVTLTGEPFRVGLPRRARSARRAARRAGGADVAARHRRGGAGAARGRHRARHDRAAGHRLPPGARPARRRDRRGRGHRAHPGAHPSVRAAAGLVVPALPGGAARRPGSARRARGR